MSTNVIKKEYSVNFNTQQTEYKIKDKASLLQQWRNMENGEKVPMDIMIITFQQNIKKYEEQVL